MSNQEESEKLRVILEAARKRFGHFGLAKTTMAEIAADIGMSKASIYYYFPDKEHLFVAVISKDMDTFISQMEDVLRAPGPAAEKLDQYVRHRFLNFQQLINLGKFDGTSHESLKPAFGKYKTDFAERERKIIADILKAGIGAREFDPLDIAVHADLFVSALQGFRTLLFKQREGFLLTAEDYATLKNYHNVFARIFIKGISRQQN